MPPAKPTNHVTRVIEQARLAVRGPDPTRLPEIPEDLLMALEGLYPPRCYDHRSESLEDHLRYAGAAELVADLRLGFERQSEPGFSPDDEDEAGEPEGATT